MYILWAKKNPVTQNKLTKTLETLKIMSQNLTDTFSR